MLLKNLSTDWFKQLPNEGMALDFTGDSSRVAISLAGRGISVTAVTTDTGVREIVQQYIVDKPIHRIVDSLPELSNVLALQTKFDLILLGDALKNVAPSSRERAFRKLSSLLKPNGKLLISTTNGVNEKYKFGYSVSAGELSEYASQYGLTFRTLSNRVDGTESKIDDFLEEIILLTLPDDGTGAFPLIRNIVVNDSKASTYKLALLRSLLRIAEGHPGAVIEQTDDCVVLPLGLVALYWLKLYKPLLDQFGMQQNSNSQKGLSFVSDSGWGRLEDLKNNDFFIGANYSGSDLVQSIDRTLKKIAQTIKNMPAKYITLPGSPNAVFHVELSRSKKTDDQLTLDFNFLLSLGKFYVPTRIWDSLTRYSVWIEPALVNEWASLMASYSLNKEKKFSKLDYINALSWDDPQRNTSKIRNRIDELLTSDQVVCCWSGKSLKHYNYAVDHAFPFARWPNNDLWNLLPTHSKVNASKSDRLPSGKKLIESRHFITRWWEQGWEFNRAEFFSQANFALPNLSPYNTSFDDVFEAFSLQRDRIKDFQQLKDWP